MSDAESNVVELKPSRRTPHPREAASEVVEFSSLSKRLKEAARTKKTLDALETAAEEAFNIAAGCLEYLEEQGYFVPGSSPDHDEDYYVLERLIAKLVEGCIISQMMRDDARIEGGVSPVFFNSMAGIWLTGYEERDLVITLESEQGISTDGTQGPDEA